MAQTNQPTNMKTFTGWEWLLIDAANQFGKDKLRFEERIQWANENLSQLESLSDQAETAPLYIKAVSAIRAAQQGQPTGHMVGVDAVCSGIQVMSALTGCISGANATGMIDPDRRADAYTDCTNEMGKILGGEVKVSRSDAKKALMTSFYGSKEQPKNIFGEKTPELEAFYEAAHTIAPGAWELLQDLLASWQAYSLVHAWKLPDGYDARIKVMVKKEARIEVDELGGASFTYEFYENQGTEKGLSNVANVTHSVDAYVLRCMHRRCNYDREQAEAFYGLLHLELGKRATAGEPILGKPEGKAAYYQQQYLRSGMADIVIMPFINLSNIHCFDTEHLEKLMAIVEGMLQYQPFPIVTVHDEFKCHANNVNWMRWQYREIMAELADSNVLDDILGQLYGMPGSFNKLSFNLADQIRGSNYALC